MRYEIRKTGGSTCPTCGATELVSTARTGDELYADIHEIVAAVTPPWWRPFARRAAKRLHRLHLEAVEQLQHLTSRV